MTNRTYIDVLQAIAMSSEEPLTTEQVLDILEDGAALAALGFGDEDQEAIEEAHALVKPRIEEDK